MVKFWKTERFVLCVQKAAELGIKAGQPRYVHGLELLAISIAFL